MSTSVVQNPVGYLRRSLSLYRELLFDPRTFYENTSPYRIRREFLLILVIGVVGSIGGYYTMTRLTSVAGITGESSTAFQLWRLAATPLMGGFILWIGGTVVLYVTSWYYTTSGSFFHLLKNTAWALVPFLFKNVLKTIALLLTTASIPDDPAWLSEFETLRQPAVRAEFLWNQVLAEPLIVGVTILGYIFVLWSGYIAAYGVMDVRSLDPGEGYRVAAVPVVIYFVYGALRLLGFL